MNMTQSSPDAPSAPAVPLTIDVFTLFPDMFVGPFSQSIIHRARERGIVALRIHDIRSWTTDRHRTVDDTPYGGGPGMVMAAPPILAAVESVIGNARADTRVIILSAAGRRFTQSLAQSLARERRLALICGRYEGIDERAAEILNADQFSIGDYVLTGGELPAMVIVDAVCRLKPGVIEDASIAEESHSGHLVEYPHYTHPADVRGHHVPDPLLKGHHARVAAWRRAKAVVRTARWRPDLLGE